MTFSQRQILANIFAIKYHCRVNAHLEFTFKSTFGRSRCSEFWVESHRPPLIHWWEIANDMGKTSTFAFALFPGKTNDGSIVEPYNTTLAMHHFIEHAAAVLVVDNAALERLCQKHLDIQTTSYVNMNRIFAQVYSNMTASKISNVRGVYNFFFDYWGMRFSNAGLNHTLAEMHENLIVVPRLHFLVSSISPITPAAHMAPRNVRYRRMPRFVEAFQPQFRNDSLDLLYHSLAIISRSTIFRNNSFWRFLHK